MFCIIGEKVDRNEYITSWTQEVEDFEW